MFYLKNWRCIVFLVNLARDFTSIAVLRSGNSPFPSTNNLDLNLHVFKIAFYFRSREPEVF